jgi:hypothetical protein
MPTILELLKQDKKDDIWKECCGFIDLSVGEFMDVQKRLLLEQIELLGQCELGKKIMGGEAPRSVEEFRKKVPLTTYKDYLPYLDERREDVLPERPYSWAHTSGRSGEYAFKWVPYTKAMVDMMPKNMFASIIFSSCRTRGDVNIAEGDILLYATAPPPYVSGVIIRAVNDQGVLRILPSVEEAEQMDFFTRMAEGFRMSMEMGMDFFGGITSVLVRISRQFEEGLRGRSRTSTKLSPRLIYKLLRGKIKSALAGRPFLPRDLWRLKGIVCGGSDTSIFKDKVFHSWGRTPLEAYGSTECGGSFATQTWNYKGMTFFPDICFLEFIPEEESRRSRADTGYKPRTLLLDEVRPNEKYELVMTSFRGGIYTRYKIGDMIKVVSLEDEELNIRLPQIVFESRVDDIIDLADFARLTEKTIWRAIEDAGISYEDWTARKEYIGESPVLHVYIETKDGDAWDIEQKVHQNLRELDSSYAEVEDILHLSPLKVTLLSEGTFNRYFKERQAAGADLGHLKPPHMNPPTEIMDRLIQMSKWKI